jgi:3-phosphoshikimate 1-carboxyvinyltransferase
MPLPSLIEIVPLAGPVSAEVTVPGSKSITNRALILAALASGRTILSGALWSEDTQVMVECLRRLGFAVAVENDPTEPSNRTVTVQGKDGVIPRGGTEAQPLELFVGNAGTAARFLTAFVCLGRGVYRIRGIARMHQRPQAALFAALRQLGYRIDSSNERLPATVFGAGPRPGTCWVDITESSQFASALLLGSHVGGWEIELAGANEEEPSDLVSSRDSRTPQIRNPKSESGNSSQDANDPDRTRRAHGWQSGGGYAALTLKMMEAFPKAGGVFQIEPDASSGSYFWAAGHRESVEDTEQTLLTGRVRAPSRCGPLTVRVAHWPNSGWQIDQRFEEVFGALRTGSPAFEIARKNLTHDQRAKLHERILRQAQELHEEEKRLSPAARGWRTISRQTDLGDSIMTAIVMAPLAILPTRFTDLGRLRHQECERVVALRTELARCGARVEEEDDTLTVHPSQLHGAEIETYDDHRMAMCFAILGLKVPGITLKNPACVKKTFPNFFQKLATPPPLGLGAAILESGSGRALGSDELFAD